jgi:hypothetical protein
MLKLKIKIKHENRSFSKDEFVDDDFSVSKSNPVLQLMVGDTIKESGLSSPEEVRVFVSFDW